MFRILLLTPQLPFPPLQGTSLRNFHILRGLSRLHDLTLLSILEPGQSVDSRACEALGLPSAAIHTVEAPSRSPFERFRRLVLDSRPDMAHRLESTDYDDALRHLLQRHVDQYSRFQVVQIEGIELARTIPTIRACCPDCKILFDDHNAEAELQRRAFLTDWKTPFRWHAAAYSFIQARRLQRFERWACRQADWVTVVSEADRQHLQRLVPDVTTKVIPNCLDINLYRDSLGEPGARFDILFTGKMDYRPNVDAALWFADKIWPRIRRERPGTTFAIVGQKPHGRLRRLRSVEGIHVTGRVDSVRPYLAGSSVFVMPLRMGSGTRFKLIEAMAAGKAIVSTGVGAEGFGVSDGQQLLLADRPQDFAEAVLALLRRPDERERLGSAAQTLAAQYDCRHIVRRFEEVYAQ